MQSKISHWSSVLDIAVNARDANDITQAIPNVLFRECHGLLLLQVTEVSCIFGASWGGGLLLSHDCIDNTWSAPLCAVHTAGLSWGFMGGASQKDVLVFIMDPDTLRALTSSCCSSSSSGMTTTVNLGGQASLTLGTYLGRHVDTTWRASRNGVGATIAISYTRGLQAGVSLETSVVTMSRHREPQNDAFYNSNATTTTTTQEDVLTTTEQEQVVLQDIPHPPRPRPKYADELYAKLTTLASRPDRGKVVVMEKEEEEEETFVLLHHHHHHHHHYVSAQTQTSSTCGQTLQVLQHDDDNDDEEEYDVEESEDESTVAGMEPPTDIIKTTKNTLATTTTTTTTTTTQTEREFVTCQVAQTQTGMYDDDLDDYEIQMEEEEEEEDEPILVNTKSMQDFSTMVQQQAEAQTQTDGIVLLGVNASAQTQTDGEYYDNDIIILEKEEEPFMLEPTKQPLSLTVILKQQVHTPTNDDDSNAEAEDEDDFVFAEMTDDDNEDNDDLELITSRDDIYCEMRK
jgi:lipid-binding SYLF domain-containing protein